MNNLFLIISDYKHKKGILIQLIIEYFWSRVPGGSLFQLLFCQTYRLETWESCETAREAPESNWNLKSPLLKNPAKRIQF